MNLADIGQLVHSRREALGLSQARLARLAGLSRATINQLENGNLVDLGAAKLMMLLDLLGMDLDARPRAPRPKAFALLSQTASVSYKHALPPGALADALVAGTLPPALVPQVATLLDEAPLPLIVAGVAEVAQRTHTPPKTLWRHLAAWAQALQSPRAAWA
jgi:transcriptional regulator with XRE-family HTH domain